MTLISQAVAAAIRAAAAKQRSAHLGQPSISRHTKKNAALAAMALTLGVANAAYAQQAPEGQSGAQAGTPTLDEVTVTGSRIRRTTDFDTANPTTVVDSDYLKNLGIVNVGAAIAQLPANVSNNSPTTTGNANFFAGSTIANLRGLNPFFGSRTLNLVNNRRFVPTNQGDGVDLNFIPSILIDRIDVVTGGASAAYGSGAISGVNNIFLNRKLEGGKADIDFGESSQSDARDRHVGLAYGTGFADGRAHFVIGYEYQKTDAVGCLNARDWCREGNAFVNSASPSFTLASNVHANQISSAGVFQTFAPVAATVQSNDAGTGTVPFNMGQGLTGSPFNLVVGGDGRSVYQYTNLRAPVKRNVATGTFTLALTDTVNMSVDLSYGKVETTNITGALDANFTQIWADNAFIQGHPELVAAQAGGQLFPGGFAFFNKDWTSQVDSHSDFTTKVQRAAIGFDGKFGSSSWGWDGYFQYGKTDRRQLVADNRHLNAYNLAIDSIMGPDGVTPICRISSAAQATAAGVVYDPRIADGCVPLNPFGTGALSPAAFNYAFGYLQEDLDYKQNVLALNASGDLFDGFGAGPIQGAIGAEYRTEKGNNIAAQGIPDYVRTDFLIQYGESFAGKVDVTEAYVETNVPLLKDAPGAKRLEFDLALRESQYKNQGGLGTTGESRTHNITTWKISSIWDPVEWLRFRGSQSRDSRAANFRELYYGQIIQSGGIFGFCGPAGTQGVDPCRWSLEGNVNLEPEKADTTTLGIVFTPKDVLSGFQFAADYFRINIDNAITQANVRRVLDGCQISGIQEFCDLLQPATPGDYSNIVNLRALAFNGSGYMYKGIDFTSSYDIPLQDSSSLNFRLLATRMLKQTFQATPGQAFVDVVGQTGTSNSFLSDNQPSARWLANLSGTYNRGPFSSTLQMRYVSSGKHNYLGTTDTSVPPPPTFVTLNTNHVPSYQVFSLSGSYNFENLGAVKTLQVFGVIDNLFDRDPPIATGTGFGGQANGGTNAVFFDTMGRSFRVGVRTTF